MSKSFNSDGIQVAWNSSSISLAETCLLKYKYRMLDGWTPKVLSVHLTFGAHYATAMEHFHKHLAHGMDRYDAMLEVVKEALINTWDTEASAPWDSMHNTKTRGNLIRSIIWYIDHFEQDPVKVVQLADGPAVEQSFAFEVDDGVIFAGHLDAIVEYGGDVWVMDQKTTGSTISPRFFEQFRPNTQMSMYSLAGKMILNSPLRGVIIDAAQIAVGFTRFERGFTMRSEQCLEEWYDSAMYHITGAQLATQEGHFPMNTASCGNYGGCEFRHICSRAPSVRGQFLKSDFVQRPPLDPLEVR